MENSATPKPGVRLTAGKLKEILASVPDDAGVVVEASDTGEANEVYLVCDGKLAELYITEKTTDRLAGILLRHSTTVMQLYCADNDPDAI